MKGKLIHSPTRIDSLYCYSLLNCSEAVHYCHSSILSKGLKFTIDNRSTTHCISTLIASKLINISHLIYFYYRAKWAIKVIIWPFKGIREI